MKNKILFACLLSLFIVFDSCSDFIDVEARGQQSLDNYFTTPLECQTFINSQYKRLLWLDDWWQLNASALNNYMATDDAWMGNTGQDQSDHLAVAHYTLTPNNMGRIHELYRVRYENISNCNYAIARISQAPIDDALKPYLIAQAKFLRAYNYFELVNNFGGVVLITEPIGTSEMNKTRSTAEETWQQIILDLLDAEADSPHLTPKEASGRVSKGACQALLARSYLFMRDYENAFLWADRVIQSGYYTLEPNFVNIWNINNHNGVESIFEIQTNINGTQYNGNHLCTFAIGRGERLSDFPVGYTSQDVMDGWGWCMPTSDLENCYLSENDEIRRRSTITKFGDPAYGDEVLNPSHKFYDNKSGRTIRKYYIPIADRRAIRALAPSWDRRKPMNFPVLRLAEMYLTRAEAAYFRNNTAQALSDINIVRARVELDPKTGLSGNDLLYAIWKERRMELAFELMRMNDLRREIDPVQNKPMLAVVMGPQGTFVQYNLGPNADPVEVSNTGERQDKGINFDIEKHLLWPIPQSEIDRSDGVIEQNPGY